MSLFWKFFIAFWLGLTVFSGSALWITSSYLEQTSTTSSLSSPRERFQQYIRKAKTIAKQQGRQGVVTWLKQLDFTEAVPFYLVNHAGEDLLNRPLPDALIFKIERESQQRGKRHTQPHLSRLRTQPRALHQSAFLNRNLIVIPNEGTYRLLADRQGITLSRVLKRPRVIALPLLIAALASALMSFLLARYLSQPINHLRKATRRVAQGDFSLPPSSTYTQDELGKLTKDFDQMTGQLKQLTESQQRLLRDVSHELRSPLARLQLALGLLQQKEGPNSKTHWSDSSLSQLVRIEIETEKMNELVGQILRLARFEKPVVEEKFRTVDLKALLNTLVDDANFEAGRTQVIFHSAFDYFIKALPDLLASAIENVIRNALKYSPRDQTIAVELEKQAEQCQITICDSGPGIPEDQLNALFEPFTRLDTARNSATGGYGIGLALAKKVIQQHRGQIIAHNRREGGLCIKIILPDQK